jgi:D-alanyl-lipoteichoic acid acyltransferase DltB (MBOAT superfamily)
MLHLSFVVVHMLLMMLMMMLQELSNYQKAHVFAALPSLLEFLGFVFCFGNMLAGPVIEFRDYQMWVRQEGPWDPAARKVPWTGDFRAVSGLQLFTF